MHHTIHFVLLYAQNELVPPSPRQKQVTALAAVYSGSDTTGFVCIVVKWANAQCHGDLHAWCSDVQATELHDIPCNTGIYGKQTFQLPAIRYKTYWLHGMLKCSSCWLHYVSVKGFWNAVVISWVTQEKCTNLHADYGMWQLIATFSAKRWRVPCHVMLA